MEKTAAKPPWKTLRVSHFPTASTATEINLEVLCSKPKTRRMSHYPWTKNGGQVITCAVIRGCQMGFRASSQITPQPWPSITSHTTSSRFTGRCAHLPRWQQVLQIGSVK